MIPMLMVILMVMMTMMMTMIRMLLTLLYLRCLDGCDTFLYRPDLRHFDTAKAFGLPRGAFMLLAGRERDGETPSTEETFEKVAACVAKGCLHGGSGDQDAYTRDGVCPKTQLPVMHRTEGTGKYEDGNRCTYNII